MKRYECVWYNALGDEGNYELLDFDPNKYIEKGITWKETLDKIKNKAWKMLKAKYQLTSKRKMLETLYLLPVDSLVSLGE